MKKALQIYHVINIMHILFYGYILVRALNIGNVRGLLEGNSQLILIGYLILVVVLSSYAKKLGDGLENPMRTVKLARILHFTSLAVFVLSFVLYIQLGKGFIYLIILSFPIDIFAFIIAYRNSRIIEKRDDLIDSFQDDNEIT